MAKPLNTITKDVIVGIYDNCEYVARIYADKIIVVTPYIKWVGNTGGYAESKQTIRDSKTIAAVLADLADDCEDTAWSKIGNYLQDDWLSQAGW
jgi:aspartate ammonia-lyase